ncbi:MAG: DAK2 domain-containing protein [Firmicutes bacterium]|nr:DAK2 domain-containing protein [Bacillota bacterium]
MAKTINGAVLRKMILNGAHVLDINKQHVDALNVFPVPDGDTGTNMSLTMHSAAKEVTNCQSNKLEDLCAAFSKGALRGARGNSGVILSQIIKGMCNVLSQSEEITLKTLARSLASGTEVAYKAVTKPKEGTILTVVRSMGECAQSINKKGLSAGEFLQKIIEAGEATLKLTPEMLDVLKKAGVVDAGGRGLLILFQGFANVLNDREDQALEFDENTVGSTPSQFEEEAHFKYTELSEIEFAYCTEFFIINLLKKTTEADIDRFREKLVNLGDCVLVIGDLSLVKVHVHTNTPGQVLTLALDLGELNNLKIENMLEQNRELKAKQSEELKPFGMVSVCAGTGLISIFKDLLVDSIIEGGQTMNPSADDIARACDSVAAEHVFVFPNNKNIILAADQAKNLSKRQLHIIPTRNIPEGLAAVLAFNPEDTLADNVANMEGARTSVKAGLVTYAVRSTQVDNFDLKEGDIIGMDNSAIIAKGAEVKRVTKELVKKMMGSDISNITLYFGNNVGEDEATAVAYELSKEYKRCDVDIHFGGQPLYYYIVSLE